MIDRPRLRWRARGRRRGQFNGVDVDRIPVALVRARDEGLALPAALVLDSPEVDLRAADAGADLHVFEAMPHGGFPGAPEEAADVTEVRRLLSTHMLADPAPPRPIA